MANRPGVMIYFDIRPALARLNAEQRGQLFLAILNYAEYGEMPELDPMTGMCFDMLRPKIDRDGEHYKDTVSQRKYAVYCREVKRTGREPIPFEEWKNERELSTDTE